MTFLPELLPIIVVIELYKISNTNNHTKFNGELIDPNDLFGHIEQCHILFVIEYVIVLLELSLLITMPFKLKTKPNCDLKSSLSI